MVGVEDIRYKIGDVVEVFVYFKVVGVELFFVINDEFGIVNICFGYVVGFVGIVIGLDSCYWCFEG